MSVHCLLSSQDADVRLVRLGDLPELKGRSAELNPPGRNSGAAFCGALQSRHYCSRAVSTRAWAGDIASASSHGARRLRARILDGVRGWFRADRRAAKVACRFRRRSCLCSVGPQWLPARACVSHADWWRTCRRPRKGTHARGRLYPVRLGVGGLRAGSFGGLANCGARCARHCRGDCSACEPRPYRRDLSARRTKWGDRRLGSSIGPDHRRRSRPWRLADRYLRLAVGVLDQPAARTCRCRHLAGLRTERSPRVRASST